MTDDDRLHRPARTVGPDAARPEPDLATTATSGVAWTMAQQWAVRISGFVTVAILTRLLSPEDFGLVALALVFLPFVQLLADMGLPTYLVQAEAPTRRTYNTAFWYSLVAAVTFSTVLIVAAPLAAELLGTPEARDVIRVLAIVPPVTIVSLVPLVLLRRALRFRVLALQAAVSNGVGQVLAVVLAFSGFGVWALVWQTLSVQIMATTMVWLTARWKPSLSFSIPVLIDMLRFGLKVVASDMVAVVRLWCENAIVVASLGVAGLGYLNIAQRLVQIAHDLTTNAVAPVSVVVFARVRDSLDRLRSGYLRAQFLAHALVSPIMLFIAVAGPSLYLVVFGPQWDQSIVPGQIFAVAGFFTMSGLDKGLFLASGKPGQWLIYAALVDGITVAVALFTAPHGLVALATGFLCVAVVATITRWFLVGRRLDTDWRRISAPLLRILPAVAAGGIAGWGADALIRGLSPLGNLVVVGVATAAGYIPVVRLTAPNVWAEMTTLIRRVVRRSSKREAT